MGRCGGRGGFQQRWKGEEAMDEGLYIGRSTAEEDDQIRHLMTDSD